MNKIGTENNQKNTYYINSEKSKNTQKNSVQEKQKKQGNKQNASIFAGDLDILQPGIFAKRDNMKKSALQVLMDAFSNEQNIDNALNERRRYVEDLNKEASEVLKEINRIEELEDSLKKTYGITDDSIEQQDLELLDKRSKYMLGLSDTPLNKEEWDRLNSMGPLTEYQKAAMDYKGMKNTYLNKLTKLRNAAKAENHSIELSERERLKAHPIVDASKTKEQLEEAARREFIEGATSQVKEKVDEKIEENQEKAEEIEEKKEEEAKKTHREEKTEIIKSKKEMKITYSTKQYDDAEWSKILRQIRAMANKENLLEEDIKGLTVDEQL